MTKPSMSLAELAEGPDADVLREMIQYVAQRLMELDVDADAGPRMASAAWSERTCKRSRGAPRRRHSRR